MTFYQRAFLYLWRKKTKTILLYMVLLAINCMILCSVMILRATQDGKTSIQEKTKSKIILEITDEKNPVTNTDIQGINALPNIASINRITSNYAYPSGFSLVTGNDKNTDMNQKVKIWAYENTEHDGAFAEQKLRLLHGNHLNASHPEGILINFILAERNGVSVGDNIELGSTHGKTVQGNVIGIFQSGSERRQSKETEAVHRIENQIYMDHELYSQLYGSTGYSKVSVYAHDPLQLAKLKSRIQEVVGDKVELTSSDTLYQRMKAPLEQVARVTTLIIILTLVTAVVVVTLLLCMWMQARRKETAIFISLGEKKGNIYLQAILEAFTVFLVSVTSASFLGNFMGKNLQKSLLDNQESGVLLPLEIEMKDIGFLLFMGGLVVLFAVGVSMISTLRTNPKDIFSDMEG